MRAGARWSRRRFLRTAGITAGAAALLPYVPRLAAAAGPPAQRLITFTMPMTTLRDEWTSNGSGPAFVSDGSALPPLAGSILSPLAGLESKLAIVDGVEPTLAGIMHGIQRAPVGPAFFSTGHFVLPSLWTGTRQLPYGPVGVVEPPLVVGVTFEASARGPSIEQAVHARLAASAPHLSTLELATHEPISGHNDDQNCVSFTAPLPGELLAQQRFPSGDPRRAFDRIFAAAIPGRSAGTRGSVLDVVRGQMTRLRAELPSEDRQRLDAHHQSILDLEARLRAAPGSCTTPPRPDTRTAELQNLDPRENARILFELIRLSFECDLARCLSFVCGYEQDGITPQCWDPTLPVTRAPEDNGLHSLSHQQDAADDAREVMRRVNRSMVGCLADLVHTLETGSDTMQSTIVAVQGTMSDAAAHSARVPPCLIVAGSATPIRTNQYLRFGTPPTAGERNGSIDNNRLLTTLAQAMGLSDVETFGEVGTYAPCADADCTEDPALPIEHAPIAELLR